MVAATIGASFSPLPLHLPVYLKNMQAILHSPSEAPLPRWCYCPSRLQSDLGRSSLWNLFSLSNRFCQCFLDSKSDLKLVRIYKNK
ncbi:hypothetical protein DITRI_Ditri18aG0022600 [Diplodiscus trichospermus]